MTGQQTVESERGLSFVRGTWRAMLRAEDLYKGTAVSPIALEYSSDNAGMSHEPSVKTGEAYLLFLKATPAGTYKFSDPSFAAQPFASGTGWRTRTG